MVALNFNSTTVAPNAALEALPSGTYDVMITASEQKPTKDGQGSYIQLEMTVQGQPGPNSMAGRKVFDRLNTNNKSQQAVDIAYATLSAICHVTGRYQIQDTAQLHGIPFKAVVAKVARDDKPGEYSNEVKGYKDAQGNDPGKSAGGGASQGGAPQGGTPQWAGQQAGGQPQQPAQQQAPQPGQPPQWAGGQQQPPVQQTQPDPAHQSQVGQGANQGQQPPQWAGQQAPQQAPQQPAQGGQPFVPGAAAPWVQGQQ